MYELRFRYTRGYGVRLEIDSWKGLDKEDGRIRTIAKRKRNWTGKKGKTLQTKQNIILKYKWNI